MSYIGTSISESPTIARAAGVAIVRGAGKAVKFDVEGNLVLCDAVGEAGMSTASRTDLLGSWH